MSYQIEKKEITHWIDCIRELRNHIVDNCKPLSKTALSKIEDSETAMAQMYNRISNTSIKSVRSKLGITQKEMAQKLGISQALVSMYESAERKTPKYILEEIKGISKQKRKA